MITIEINGITLGDAFTPLDPNNQILSESGRKVYVQGVLGVVDPNIFFRNPASVAGTPGAAYDGGYRLDVTHVLQSAPAGGGSTIRISDLLGNEFQELADLTLVANVGIATRSFPIPPGYLIQFDSDTLTGLRFGLTQLPTPADLQYIPVGPPPP